MKILCLLFITAITAHTFAQTDSSKTKLKAGAIISLNSNGIASVPAFSLDKPAIMASMTLVKNRFSYEPQLAYGLDLRPWVIDNWLRYKIINRPSFEFRTGLDISAFFSDYELPDGTILQSQRYFAFEVAGVYKFSPKSYLSVAYWSDNGQDRETLKGHFIDLIAERSEICIGKHLFMAMNIQLFYIDYNGDNDGLFLSPKISWGARKIPFSILLQATQALITNISPFPEFRWNLGLAYIL